MSSFDIEDWKRQMGANRRVEDEADAGAIDLFGSDTELKRYGSMLTVLSIDDDIKVLKMEEEMFSSSFKEFRVADGGKEGLKIARTMRSQSGLGPDLIILDLDMPDMNGISFAEQWRLEKPSQSYIIFTSYRGGQAGFFQRLTGGIVGIANSLVPGRTVAKDGGEFLLQDALVQTARSLHTLHGWKNLTRSP